MAKIISFCVSTGDRAIIDQIGKRAVTLGNEMGRKVERLHTVMDITAVHANVCHLRLDELLAANDSNFAHDVFGIDRHLDRQTGKLGGHFLPRYAAGKQ